MIPWFALQLVYIGMSRANKPGMNSKLYNPKKPVALTWKEKLTSDEYEQLKSVFDIFDEDQSGYIDPEQINRIISQLGEEHKQSFVYSIVTALKGKGKRINFDEFLELVCPKVGDVKTKQGIRTIFNHIDRQGDQVIDFQQLKQLARISGDSCNDEVLIDMLHSIYVGRGTASNECLTFEQFYAIVSSFHKK